METSNFKVLDQYTHCFYNGRMNQWGEYKWDDEMSMFAYSIYSEDGRLQHGYMGVDAIMNKKETEAWVFIGCL